MAIHDLGGRLVRHGLFALMLAALAGGAAAERGGGPGGGAAGGWQVVANPAPVLGADGQVHEAACSGLPGTDPSFRFWVRRGSSRNLVVFFEGGGACWDDFTCSFPAAIDIPPTVPQFYTPSIGPEIDPRTYDGLFNLAHPGNPVRDWSFVYIPYCTGDLHTGSATRGYTTVLPPPTPFTLRHGGFDNFMVVLDWMKRHVDAPEQLLVTGSSAGGYGASVNFPWVQRAFPRARLSVLADASQSVTTPTWDFGLPGHNTWNPQLPPGIPGADLTTTRSADYLRFAARAHPRARVAQFTTRLDEVQIGFYGVMKENYGPGGACPDPVVDWNQQMLASLQDYTRGVPNFRHFVAEGTYHTILASPVFYTDTSAGAPFNAWLGAMLDRGENDRDEDRSPRRVHWRNLACPGCLTPLPCP